MKSSQSGFTLVEIAIVLLIVTILLGYTVALFPQQQQLKQYRAVNLEMDRVMETIIGFAQVNGRLPCPAQPDGAGVEDINGIVGCNTYAGFVPVNLSADQIAGQQVGRELNAAELGIQCLGQRVDHHRLGNAWNAFQ